MAASAEDAGDTGVPEEEVVAHIRSARTRAVAEIMNGSHPPSIAEGAIDTLDHAIYAAISESQRDEDLPAPRDRDLDPSNRVRRQ
ncbi:MAG TPA: hypothetical protein VII69_00040 [Candidatus Eremiobacteraceae bacterium]